MSDCEIYCTDPLVTRLLGPGELIELPSHLALKVLLKEPDHFKILKPLPMLPGVAVRWLLPDDTAQGPGLVQLVDGEPPNRQISVLHEEKLCWIHERDIVEIDPWPAIDAKLDETLERAISEGEESPKVLEVREWLCTHFDED
ncbi:MAG: hypothetical protein HZC50_09660 [Nitrospirae bacterium]|nr:hypothetical protein [Nitrospirota bacterium]